MSRSLNKVMLIGNVGSDPEVRATASGSRVAKLSLATNRTFPDKSGQQQERTDWHRLTFFGKLADIVERCGPRATLQANPVFWLRLVGYAYVCNHLVRTQGADLGFESGSLDVPALLRGVRDDHITSHIDAYQPTFDMIIARSL